MNLGKFQAFALAAALTIASVLTALVHNGWSWGHAAPSEISSFDGLSASGVDRSITSSTEEKKSMQGALRIDQ